MSQLQFLPFLTDDQGRSLVKEGGVVVTKPIPTPTDTPEGWEGNSIEFARNDEFRGIIKTFITQLKFFNDAAFVLRDKFYRKGIEIVLFFIWLKLDQNFGGDMKHKGWYKGEPDMSTFKDEWDGVEVNITEGGFYKQLQANKNIPYELPLDNDLDAVSLSMDGMDFYNNTHYAVTDGFGYSNSTFAALVPFLNVEGANVSIQDHGQNFENIPGALHTYCAGSSNFILKNVDTVAKPVHITGSLFLTATQNGTLPASLFRLMFCTSIQYQYSDTVGINANPYQLYNLAPAVGASYRKDIDYTINLLPGECLFLIGIMVSVNLGVFNVQFSQDSRLNIEFTSRKAETIIKAYTVFDAGNKLINKISNNISHLTSDLLSNDVNLLVTSGDAIRGISGAVFKSTFSDYHKSVDAVKCIALDVVNNNAVIVSRYDKFNRTSSIGALGECSNWTLRPAEKYMYSSALFGYPPKDPTDNNNLNGKYSFCNTSVYKSPYTRKVNVYDAVSRYYADPYLIELIRINLENKTTTDGTSDNDNFFIDAEKVYADYVGDMVFSLPAGGQGQVVINQIGMALKAGVRFKVLTGLNNSTFTVTGYTEAGGQTTIYTAENVTAEVINTTIVFLHYKLRRLVYASITGIPSASSVFNIELSPARVGNRHFRWLKSSFDHMDNLFFTFQTTDKNADLETIDGAGTKITEKANYLIGNMGEKVFLPYYFGFEVQSPYNLLELVKANNSGYFGYTMNGIEMKGFIEDIKTNDATLETQEYMLLATADNDLTKLINNR